MAPPPMARWFPCREANNEVYSVYGQSAPFYVWGMNGWGGQLSGLELSNGAGELEPVQCSTHA